MSTRQKMKCFWIFWMAIATGLVGESFLWAGNEKIIKTVSNFEQGAEERTWKSKDNVKFEISEDFSHSGKSSLKYEYDLSTITYAWIRTSFEPPIDVSDANGLRLWVKGDGSNNSLQPYIIQKDDQGKEKPFPSRKKILLDFNDWKEFFVTFPEFNLPEEELKKIVCLNFHIYRGVTEKLQSSVYIDDIDFVHREISVSKFPAQVKTDLEFFSCIDISMTGLENVKDVINKNEIERAKAEFVKYMQNRHPRYFFDFKKKNEILETYYKLYGTDAFKGAIASCQNILDQDFTYEGFRVKVEGDMVWDSRKVNTGWVWGSWITRMQFLITLGKAYWATGDEKYSKKALFYIEDFNKKNPVPGGSPARSIEHPGWGWGQSLHPAERLDSWICAYQYLANSPEFTVEKQIEFFKHLIEHAQWLHILETDGYSGGNFQIVECGALALAGIWFPESKFAKNWLEMAITRLNEHLKIDTLNDGAHSELTPGYHGWCVEKYMKTLRLAQLNNIKLPDGFESKLIKMFEWYVHLIGPDGRTPAMGDSGRVAPSAYLQFGSILFKRQDFKYFSPTNLLSEWFWYFGLDGMKEFEGIKSSEPGWTSSFLPNSQYITMRSGWDKNANYLFFDCAPYGGGHSHPDALSIDVSSYGRPIIVDPGAGGYAREEHTLFHRKTRAHSVIMIDGKEQPIVKPVVNCWKTSDEFDFAEGSIDLGEGIKHTRRILFVKPDYFILQDIISGDGKHNLEQIFRFAKDIKPHFQSAYFRLINEKELEVLVDNSVNSGLLIVQVMKDGISLTDRDGMVEFDNKPPAVIFSKSAELPAQFMTLIYPLKKGQPSDAINVKETIDGIKKNSKIPSDILSKIMSGLDK